MPIFEQGYRPYTGEVRRGSRALAIAWESIRPRMRWFIWLIGFLFLFWPYLILGGLTYLVLMAGLKIGTLPPVPTMAFANKNPGDLRSMMSAALSADASMFWEVLKTSFQFTGPVVLPTVACAGILASDRRTGALQIYLARPVSRTDYLLGKILAVTAFGALLTAVPSLALWAECAALQPTLDWFAGTWWVPFSILAASAAYTLWTAGLILLVSSFVNRPVLIGTVVIFGFLFLLGFGSVLGRTLDPTWYVIVPHYALGAVTAPLFGLGVPDWLPLPLCALTAFGFPLLCFAVVWRRVRAVEVVT